MTSRSCNYSFASTTGDLPSLKELPNFKELPGCAWDVWGKGDELGTVNLLTDEVVRRAAKEEIQTGRSVCLNWPLNLPSQALFDRRQLAHTIMSRTPIPRPATNDDELHFNPQSGTHWVGLRHVGIFSHNVFYQGVEANRIPKGKIQIDDPANIDPDLVKLGIHNWAQHGICGRGVLVDIVKFYTESGMKPLPYDPWKPHSITVTDIQAAANSQGVEFRQGDILLIRMGFFMRFESSSQVERDALGGKPGSFAGLEQSLEMKEFLWDNHFAAVASDQPSLERWPPVESDYHLHQTIIGLWGMPIGKLFDMETLSKVAQETGRYTFFLSSWPLNVLGGVASTANAAAIF